MSVTKKKVTDVRKMCNEDRRVIGFKIEETLGLNEPAIQFLWVPYSLNKDQKFDARNSVVRR